MLVKNQSKRNPQLDLFKAQGIKLAYATAHGGTRNVGRRKVARPLSTKNDIHLVLKSRLAIGRLSLYKQKTYIHELICQKARKFGVHIKDYVNMGNHLHIKLRASSRPGFQKFLISITALIARKVTGAKKGFKFGKFWDGLAFTRVVKTKLESLQLKGYFEANSIEHAHGQLTREVHLAEWNDWIYRLRYKKRQVIQT